MLGFKKTPDEVIRQLKKLGKESFEEYAWRMEEQWLTVNKKEAEAGIHAEQSRCFTCPGAAAAATAKVLTVSELMEFCRKEQGEIFDRWLLKGMRHGKSFWNRERPISRRLPLILWSSC